MVLKCAIGIFYLLKDSETNPSFFSEILDGHLLPLLDSKIEMVVHAAFENLSLFPFNMIVDHITKNPKDFFIDLLKSSQYVTLSRFLAKEAQEMPRPVF